jgi:four helix bundle suffix protein
MTKNGNDGRNVKNDGDGNDNSHSSHNSQDRLLSPRGDYQTLLSFQKAEVIYDITFRFAHKYLARGDRTIDQMIQSARSGKKNILEGSKAALTSKETEIKLTNVARASLEELLDDYRDYLRARDLRIWDKESQEALYVRRIGRKTPQTYEDYREFVETRPAEVIANIAICLIHQTNYLLDQQLRRLEQDFLEQGGLRERMTRARIAYRNGSYGKNASDGGTNTRRNRASPAPPSSPDPSPTPDSDTSPNSHSSPPRKPRHPGGQP